MLIKKPHLSVVWFWQADFSTLKQDPRRVKSVLSIFSYKLGYKIVQQDRRKSEGVEKRERWPSTALGEGKQELVDGEDPGSRLQAPGKEIPGE